MLTICFVLAIVMSIGMNVDGHRFGLNGNNWTLCNSNKSIVIGSTVPGDVYTDLMRASILLGDPYYRDNDVQWRWVAYDNWTWSYEFNVSQEFLDQSRKWVLVAEGIDTVAVVTLNDHVMGRVDNMFIRYQMDVSPVLKMGQNVLVVSITSPVLYARRKAMDYPYSVPPQCVPPLFNGECHVNFIRKEQRSFGWDLGPAFPTMGIWKSLYIESGNSCQIQDVLIHTVPINGNLTLWSIEVKILLKSHGPPMCRGYLSANISDLQISHKIPYQAQTYVKLIMNTTKTPNLWWPNGYGRAALYRLTLELLSPDGVVESSKSVMIGFRKVKLIQRVTRGMAGLSFYFQINNRPVFAKGANYVPSDCFQSRVSRNKTEFLLRSAQSAGMNMIRVWGGGVYERDYFYELADQFGVMVWQDAMFAGTMYPVDEKFLSSVRTEVRQQISRLQYHASIVVWAANSENEEFLSNNTFGTKSNFSLYKSDYIKLYIDTVMVTIKTLDPLRPLLSSTQSNGVHSKMAGWVAADPNSELYGDVHFYHYFDNVWDWRVYPVSKFASEFGFQSLPSFHSLLNISEREDWNIDSHFWQHRQHHKNGMKEVRDCAENIFKLPNSTEPVRRFKHFLYLYQVNQAMVVKTETENYRVSRDRIMPYTYKGGTMGALYWQLNDIWPAPSWGSIDSNGRWKILHYFAKNFFKSSLIIPQHENNNAFSIYLVCDLGLKSIIAAEDLHSWMNYREWNYVHTRPTRDFMLVMKFYKWWRLGEPEVVTVQIRPDINRFSQLVHRETFPASCHGDGCLVIIELHHDNELLSENFLLSTDPKYFSDFMLRARIRIIGVTKINDTVFSIALSTSQIALFVAMETAVSGTFSENGFHMVNREKIVSFEASDHVQVEEFRRGLSITSLSDIYQ